MQIGVKVIGERRVALRFETFPDIAHDKLLEVVTDFQQQLQSAVADKIPVKTGALASTVDGGVENGPNRVRGWVNVAGKDRAKILQAVALEYGSNKGIQVKEKAGRTLRTVYGHYIAPMQVLVGAYTRQSNIAAQMFLRAPLEQLGAPFLDAAEAAVNAAVEATE